MPQCNMCQVKSKDDGNLTAHNGYISPIEFCGGYHSTHLMDLIKYTINLCEACARNLLDNCSINPSMSYDSNSFNSSVLVPRSYSEDQTLMRLQAWNSSKEYNDAYLNKKCNFKINCPNEALYSIILPAFDEYEVEPTNSCFCQECLNIFKPQQEEQYGQYNTKPQRQLDFSHIVGYIDPMLRNFL